MGSFYFITIIVFFTLFVVSLVLILYMTYNQESKYGGLDASKPYPPVQNTCPDQWTYDDANKTCNLTLASGSTPASANLEKNAGIFVNPNTGVVNNDQFNKGSVGFISTLSLTGSVISFQSEDPDFSKNASLNCGRKNFSKLKGLAWEGVTNYGPC